LLRNELKLPQAEAITGNPNGVVAPKTKRRGEMEMNRDFLKGLGLEKEAIDTIMARHGSEIGDKETEITNLNKKITGLEDDIADLQDGGDEELKGQLATLEKEKKDLEQQLADQSRQHKLETYVNSLGTKDAAYIMAKLDDVELKDDEFIGIDERVEELKEAHPLLFEADEPKEPQKPKPWSQGGNGTVNKGTWTREQIMEVRNPQERRKLISENKELFK
jgi:hypothetical protein